MRKKLTWVVLLSAAIGVAVLYTGNAWATPAIGFVSTTLAMGRFDQIDAFNNMVSPQGPEEQHGSNVWLSLQRTKGLSDLYVQSNVWQPGGTSGWHTHPGHSLITVIEGTVTAYEADDPDCTVRLQVE